MCVARVIVAVRAQVLRRFRAAYASPWAGSHLRYVGDGRPFWRHIVEASTGCADAAMFEVRAASMLDTEPKRHL